MHLGNSCIFAFSKFNWPIVLEETAPKPYVTVLKPCIGSIFTKFFTGKYTIIHPLLKKFGLSFQSFFVTSFLYNLHNRLVVFSNPSVSYAFLYFIPKIYRTKVFFKHQNQLQVEYFEPYKWHRLWPFLAC